MSIERVPISTGRPQGHHPADLLDDGRPARLRRPKYERGQGLPHKQPVGRKHHHGATIDAPKLSGRVDGRAGHAGQIRVAEEVVLHRDSCGLAGGRRDLDARLGLDRLVDAVAPLAALAQPAGELVDDHDLSVADDVLAVADVFPTDDDRPLDVLEEVRHADGRESLRFVDPAHPAPALFREPSGPLPVVVFVVLILDEILGCLGRPAVAGRIRLSRLAGSGDDQRGSRLVDEDAVGLVDDGQKGLAVDRLLVRSGGRASRHLGAALASPAQQEPVAEEVEPELLGRAVGDVAGVSLASLGRRHLRLNRAHG